MTYQSVKHKQLELLTKIESNTLAKRVNIVSLKLVRESSLLYKERQVKSPEDASNILNIKNDLIKFY
ncbi:hypothetical protein [Bacillus cereus]|uniref:hypothetical protein n=1 Tax=Bacillus cereus TaxID=1396 RepID=UPI002B253F30|nr:hypothetical protein [Bacillus cereus]MEB2584710.1 hypothetical protein [Bacillus cereus]MEB2612188.1 hypothetical protein [Bacillus cereus]